jgi:hypothetical protein
VGDTQLPAAAALTLSYGHVTTGRRTRNRSIKIRLQGQLQRGGHRTQSEKKSFFATLRLYVVGLLFSALINAMLSIFWFGFGFVLSPLLPHQALSAHHNDLITSLGFSAFRY